MHVRSAKMLLHSGEMLLLLEPIHLHLVIKLTRQHPVVTQHRLAQKVRSMDSPAWPLAWAPMWQEVQIQQLLVHLQPQISTMPSQSELHLIPMPIMP